MVEAPARVRNEPSSGIEGRAGSRKPGAVADFGGGTPQMVLTRPLAGAVGIAKARFFRLNGRALGGALAPLGATYELYFA